MRSAAVPAYAASPTLSTATRPACPVRHRLLCFTCPCCVQPPSGCQDPWAGTQPFFFGFLSVSRAMSCFAILQLVCSWTTSDATDVRGIDLKPC